MNSASNPPSAETVRQYLLQHPGFLQENSDLLSELVLPHETGNAVSLIERQVAVLRSQRSDLKNKLQQLVEAARTNEQLLRRMEQLIIRLLDARDRQELIARLETGLQAEFQLDAFALGVLEDEDSHQLFEKIITRKEPVSGHLAQPQKEFLFADQAGELASGALIPLFDPASDTCFAMIGMGSTSASRFHAEMGTLFLAYLGKIVARLWLRMS